MARMDACARDGVERLLHSIPRRQPPPIELAEILARGRSQLRRRGLIAGMTVGVLALAAGFLASREEPEPIVHRVLRIVDMNTLAVPDPGATLSGWLNVPEELRAP